MNTLETVMKLLGFNVREARKKLDVLHQLTNEDYAIYQRRRLENIVRYHLKNNTLYQQLAGHCPVNSFEELPVITKRDFQRPIRTVISKGLIGKGLYLGSTSGSSGTPLLFAKDKESHALTHAIMLSCYARHGINATSRQARFYCMPVSGMARYKEMLKDILMRRVRFSVIDLSEKQFKGFVEKFKRIKFDYINGYTTALVCFARYLIQNNLILKEIDPRLKCCIVTSEVCTSEDKTLLETAFGVRILNEYGASEVGIIAFEDAYGNWEIQTDDLYVEVVDEQNKPLANGKEGRILITSLSNKAFPIIRYEIGDIGVVDKENNRLILKKLTGRTRDMIKLPSGRIASGVAFSYIANSMLKKSCVIHELIVKQTSIDTFELDAVMERDLTTDEIQLLNSGMESYLESGLHLQVNRVEKIERPASGKLKLFYSMIS